MKNSLFVTVVGLLGALPAAGTVTTFTDQAAFLAAVGPNVYLESFDSTETGGTPDPIPYASAGFNYVVDTSDPGESGLFPFLIPGGSPTDVIMSTNSARDHIRFDFSGDNVTAVGAFVLSADISGNVITSDLTVDTDQTDPMTVSPVGTTTFVGFLSDAPFDFFTLIADSTLVVSFAAANDFIVGGKVLDSDDDGVPDDEDNCIDVFNPRLGEMGAPERQSFQTTTGGQLDDDADGFGNPCDAKFGTGGQVVGGIDVAAHIASFNKNRDGANCGASGDQPCAPFDLDNAGQFIGGGDLTLTFQLFNQAPGPGCPACPLGCVGPACPE